MAIAKVQNIHSLVYLFKWMVILSVKFFIPVLEATSCDKINVCHSQYFDSLGLMVKKIIFRIRV